MNPENKALENIDDQSEEQAQLISYRTMRILIGLVGIALPLILLLGSGLMQLVLPENHDWFPPSISDFHGTRMQDWYTGILFVLGFFLLTYKGYGEDNWVANIGCAFALGTAVFDSQSPYLPVVILHFVSALSLFAVFIVFSLILFPRSRKPLGPDGKPQPLSSSKIKRNRVYAISGWTMVGLIPPAVLWVALGGHKVFPQLRIVFWVESLMLWSFGIAWLTKGQALWFKDPGMK
jgi:hypothetical protein